VWQIYEGELMILLKETVTLGICGLFFPLATTSAQPQFSLMAQKVDTPPEIDGALDDEIWLRNPGVETFLQYEPNRGALSETRTQVLVLYDDANIYAGFRLWDAQPPTAQLTRRDADLFNDDSVILLLDTHHDRRSAYFFMTNALATQTDGRIADDGRTVDVTWDAPWQCAAQHTDFGWSVEMAIPFTSIKYISGDSVTWGINFGRSRRSNLEISFWTGPLDNQFRVSQAGILTGLNIPKPLRRQQIIPYGLTSLQENRPDQLEVGGDIRYAVTPQMSAYVTVNPDFATIEADQEEVNLTRFELALAEKRQFFLEGNELFLQRIRTFYSRRIPDITLGGKVLGRQGPWTFAALASQSEPLGDSSKATYTVARAQKDVLGSSNMAFMVANRSLEGDNRGSASFDATLFFTKTIGMTGQLIRSYGPFDDGVWAYFVRPAYDSPTGHFHVRYTHMGENFGEHVNATGFVRDDDRRELDSALERIFWLKNRWLERTHYQSNYNIYWGQDGTLRSWQIDQSVEMEFRNRYAAEIAYTEEFKRFEKDFRNRQLGLEIGYNTREFQSAQVGFQFGRNFDSDFRLWTAEAGYKPTSQLSLEYELQRLTLDPDPETESTWIHVLKANQFFMKDLFLRIFFQTNSQIDRRNLQAVFVYRYQPPFGTIQLAYQRGTAEFGQRSKQGNTLFLKTTRVF
jgi:hypothetical protein